MREVQELLGQIRDWKERYVPWLDLSDPYHQLAVISAVIVAGYAIGEGGLPISVPWWQLGLVTGLIYYVLFADGPVPQLENSQAKEEFQDLPTPPERQNLD